MCTFQQLTLDIRLSFRGTCHVCHNSNRDIYGDVIPHGAIVRLGTERFRVPGSWRSSITFSRDGQTIVSCTESGQLRWWEAGTGKLKKIVEAKDVNARAFASAPDGRTIALMGFRFVEAEARIEYSIQTFDIDTAKRIDSFQWEEKNEIQT